MDITPQKILSLIRSGEAPQEIRQSAAKGALPLGPAAMLESLMLLAGDQEEAVRKDAVKSLRKIPRSMVLGVSSAHETPPALLHRLARLFARDGEITEKILLNGAVSDETVAFLATLPNPSLLDIVGRNHVRLERFPQIYENLKMNAATPKATLGLVQEVEARRHARESRTPREGSGEKGDRKEERAESLPEILVREEEGEEGQDRQTAAVEEKKATIQQILKEMSAGQKVALAMKGNGEVRKILIRDKNRLICEKVLENPRVTDSEIESFAKSTNVSEDVLRIIGNRREWASQPSVMKALVCNPRTPVALSLGFLKRLSLKELEGLSKNRNVPEALRNTARKMHKQKLQARG